ncbi:MULTISPECIES: hypothetical protein [Actinomadura]|uniref:Uncharacterized protein n=1 Tax=Actinomadura litoris TaxID=2678616 RepID=A0A7K1L5E6_9ACTN|nr:MULTISPECIES: hypothetical protein [Actinomadura]MBT2212499.1 hypothetical protein [Actinomadura sp. NEAU-AAG7]MUN39475.1 hypothetical protein [Actinomadura litoris]
MSDAEPGPEPGEIRFRDDGTLEAFDGTAWAPYRPPEDDGLAAMPIFKHAAPGAQHER